MQHSVSDIYGTDEIDFLLDDIPGEPACCQQDFQDFDIAGSRAGDVSTTPLDSPLGTCSSWDSHLNYRERINQAQNWGVTLHCDPSHLKTPTGFVRILLVISSACCLAFECSAGTVQVGLFLLPLIGRLRLMVFCALFSLLITCLMLFMDVSHIALMFPFNWGKLNAWLYLTIGLLFLLGSSLIIHAIFCTEEYAWVAKYTKDTLLVSAIVGYFCAIEAFVLSLLDFYSFFCCKFSRRSSNDDRIGLKEDREMTPLGSYSNSEKFDQSGFQNQLLKKFKRSASQNLREYFDDTTTLDNQKSAYVPIKRPDQAYNQKPKLGSKHKNRHGYHYEPVGEASTSRYSPSFVIDPNEDFDDDELIIPIVNA